ncbi:Bax inhibitor-1/YccA family protein (plasmid) [Nitratireductor rhodophyticola]|uniref:Bax inhibitor-1/YccA family protein n=1 Tax=Nitratireductor rhodophyticola TaxID=2854036 RepID=A0ABS7RD40_9HYPH|nr:MULTISPECIES: Bax inhibitor-1/YccA family protein [Phyllobacteriaceae]MBY8918841.1 Bax inhibitor-1/YccA family protein [Nitratireductor rhodophyticola]MEC9246786.1 Bax inhibitor-1/YccA family protein [Pseudomonadota bacterium]MBY8923104.1 Bax inhibitor-1/YccA family protein [Nitratireductor rhodophyticola]MCO6388645.1 BAX inhibitor (BI)-1/YccA family protein [Aliihoeflea sp. 40Bstr573]WPZ16281.1 Bax inhibitor-1/YccA family protein [Nitratireductor rhodophyticola]
MADLRNIQATPAPASARTEAAIDEGLRAYMIRVYNLMALGLAITGVAAFATAQMAVSSGQLTGFGQLIFASPLRWMVMLAPLGFVFFLSARIQKMTVSAAQTTFWAFAAVMGLSLASIFLVYTGESIVRVFFITAASFGALSLWGYSTKRDLSGMGSFLFMGLIGLILAMIVNIFLASSALQFAISAIGVLIFAGLTAYDTQQIKEMYWEGDDTLVAGRKAIMGALRLYLDFINLFMFLLQFLGNRE